MNIPEDELEKEMKELMPVSCSDDLFEKISAELSEHEASPDHISVFTRFMPLMIAASFGFSIGLSFYFLSKSETLVDLPVDVLATSESTQEEGVPLKEEKFIGMNDEGMGHDSDGRMYRQYRYHFVDTVTWKGRGEQSTYNMSVPREEVFKVRLAHY